MTDVLKWVVWWNSTEALPEQVTHDVVVIELNTDFSTKGLSAAELTAIVAAWQNGALSRDSMLDLFRRGEILLDGRTNEEELIQVEAKAARPSKDREPMAAYAGGRVNGSR